MSIDTLMICNNCNNTGYIRECNKCGNSMNDLRNEIGQDVRKEFKRLLNDHAEELQENIINYAIDNVFETSAIQDEGYYNNDDVKLACRRAIVDNLKI